MDIKGVKSLTLICGILTQLLGLCMPAAIDNYDSLADNPDIQLFQEYLRINTTTYGDLDPAIAFWRNLSEPLGLNMSVYEYSPGQPVIVIEWPGDDPTLSSIMLNSHMDVVPTNVGVWTYPPFSATLDDDGVIWGRGTQDMKSVSIQYFLALKRLRERNVTLARTTYMTLMPDEEVGGMAGMQSFLKSDEFAAMNVGLEMDEGGGLPYDFIVLFYQDKAIWQFKVTCSGSAVHSSTFPASNVTAIGKCRKVIDTFMDFRDEQHEIAVSLGNPLLNSGKYTSVNLNRLNAGTANNIVPATVELVFDIRLDTSINATEFEQQVYDWLAEAGEDVVLESILKDQQAARTATDDSNPFYVALENAAQDLNITLLPIVAPGGTDGRFVRLLGIPAFGFSPMPNTETLAHAVNERLNATTFLNGITDYETIIEYLANVVDDDSNTSTTEGTTTETQCT